MPTVTATQVLICLLFPHADVLAVITEISDLHPVQLAHDEDPVLTRKLIVKDASTAEMLMILWGRRATQFNVNEVRNANNGKQVLALFVGCLMKTYKGHDYISCSSANKWYFDPDILEAAEFQNRSRQDQVLTLQKQQLKMHQPRTIIAIYNTYVLHKTHQNHTFPLQITIIVIFASSNYFDLNSQTNFVVLINAVYNQVKAMAATDAEAKVLVFIKKVVERELIVGWAVGFRFFTLLLPSNDDIAGVPTSVDDGAKVARGGVTEVAAPLLVRLDCTAPALGALRIDEPTAFLLDVICVFYLDVGWGFTIHCYVHGFVEWIKEVVIVVV
ncbi:hypothetical protein C2845_PM04G11550 [Panicum miliaceum]|uniref:Replication protein A OB domain-containing protein n=1 Tax=Panicum miliaceum TaxID=4540 RepID=A0A3L6QN69_PANMI|nr:hypothetical protein C2845_PM04G11550 [Panicum miliaceum]